MPNERSPWVANPIKADKIDATKIDHLQVFGPSGDQIASIYWTPTGRYRVRVGWFGRMIVEEQLVYVGGPEIAGYPEHYRWQRAPRGTTIQIARIPRHG